MRKQLLILITSVVLIVSLFPVNIYAENTFTDVGENHWAKNEIEFLANKGIINGYANGLFGPDDNLTRIQIALMINRDKNYDFDEETHTFNDVPQEYKNVVSAVSKHGLFDDVVKGNIFDPYKKVTRAEMSSILSVAYQLEGKSEVDFQDVPSTHWAYSYVQGLAANKITTGVTETTFNPDGLVTRAQFSVFMTRIIKSTAQDNEEIDDSNGTDVENNLDENLDETKDSLETSLFEHSYKWSNFWMGGFVFSDTDTIYVGHDGLTLFDKDGEVTLSNDTASWINAVGDYVYFISMSDYAGYKVKKDGTQLKKIIDESLFELYVQDENIFYTSDDINSGIIKTDLEGKNPQTIVDTVDSFYIENNTIYFTKRNDNDSFDIYSISTEGKNEKLLKNNTFAYAMLSDEEYLYFQNEEENVYKMKKDGSDFKKIIDQTYHFFLYEDKVIALEYLGVENDQYTYNIYSYDKDGNNKTKLTIEPITSFYIISEIIFAGKVDSNNPEIIVIP
ncbi:S-layer homology domain-containing protein [Cytobacillus sp. IB215316]|uniref:S-layer homology domain-containing protein n=1 Tax=Cytobacillus sp. IB215316 TaxID=3097354 RepID=UPI002A14FDDC|nr:S-layer homology domain-containing protein [Cytobacillus sp. IB215316]MDX8361633.1 S-layer homology domain-containing protein [Cytobacillus sp. IB215316]